MNKKVIVILALAYTQSAHALWEFLLKIPVIKAACVLFMQQNNNRTRKSIVQAPEETETRTLSFDGLSGHGLKVTSYLPAHIAIDTHNQSKILITCTVYAASRQAMQDLVCDCTRIDGGDEGGLFEVIVFKKDTSENMPKQKSSWWSKLPFLNHWQKTEPTNQSPFDIKITIPESYSTIKCLDLPAGNVSLTSKNKLKADCFCSTKKGDITVDNLEGAIDATIVIGKIATSRWSLPKDRKIENNRLIIGTIGYVTTTIPENTNVTLKKSSNVTWKASSYKKTSLSKGSNFHLLTIENPGTTILDPK